VKTSTTYKIQLIQRAIKDGQKPEIMLRGSDLTYKVEALRNRGHSLEITIDRRGGVLAIDPDDILVARFVSLPARDEE
jgi:hypothetical protein